MDKSSLEALIRWLEIGAAIFGVVVVLGVLSLFPFADEKIPVLVPLR